MNTDIEISEIRCCGYTKEEKQLAGMMVYGGEYDTIRIGGSYITNPDTANDIDLIISAWEFYKKEEHIPWEAQGWVKQCNDNGVASELEYDTDFAIICHYRKGAINLIVINNIFYPAYVGAIRAMHNNPELYQTREKRVELHSRFRVAIDMIIHGELLGG